MSADLAIETRKPAELGGEERALWAAFRAADPILHSPHFDFRYMLAAGEAAPGAEVAVISHHGKIQAFLPFQRRGRLIQPIAAPLTDYHGLVAAPGASIDLTHVVAALGARRFRFSGLVAGTMSKARVSVRPAMVADLSGGLDAYLARRSSDFLKDKRRRARRLEEQRGPLEFALRPHDEGVLEFVIALKRDQMRRTGQHDIFASAWTSRFLHEIDRRSEPDFGLRFASLRAGGRLIAAEIGLLSGSAYHLWLPVYDPEFARYSPGALMTLETLRAAAGQGIGVVDFGPAAEAYKRDFAEPRGQVFEGDVTAGGVIATTRHALDVAFAGAPNVRGVLSAAGRRLDRRWDRITACEPRLEGRVGAASQNLTDIARQRPKTAIGVGLGVGGLTAGILAMIAD